MSGNEASLTASETDVLCVAKGMSVIDVIRRRCVDLSSDRLDEILECLKDRGLVTIHGDEFCFITDRGRAMIVGRPSIATCAFYDAAREECRVIDRINSDYGSTELGYWCPYARGEGWSGSDDYSPIERCPMRRLASGEWAIEAGYITPSDEDK